MSDVPRSLQSWISTIQTGVLTADIFQLLIKRRWTERLTPRFKCVHGNVFPRYIACETCDHFLYRKIQSPWLRKDSLFSRTILRGSCDQSLVGPWPATHSCTSTIKFKVKYTEVLCRIAVRVWHCVPRLMRYQVFVYPTTQPQQTSPQPKPNTTLLRGSTINIYI